MPRMLKEDVLSTVSETSQIVDAYIRKREERLLADRVADKLKEEENELKKRLVTIAIDGKAKTLGGSLGAVNYKREEKPVVTDWPALHDYIWERRAFDLLHKALTTAAVLERWEDGIRIPGVGTWPVDNLTISGKNK